MDQRRDATDVGGERHDRNMDADDMLTHYSAALDEIYRLRRALEYEARVVEAHFQGYKTFPKTRRKYAEEQVERMREAASGHAERAYAGHSTASLSAAAKSAMPNGLSRGGWESRG